MWGWEMCKYHSHHPSLPHPKVTQSNSNANTQNRSGLVFLYVLEKKELLYVLYVYIVQEQ